ncbi:MAG: ACT domain-containing protein [Clostridiaceae bacterium]
MRAIITVIGKDQKGIIATVSNTLAKCDINILDISQTILEEYFTMIMLVDLNSMNLTLDEIKLKLNVDAENLKVSIRIQREDLFNSMHSI